MNSRGSAQWTSHFRTCVLQFSILHCQCWNLTWKLASVILRSGFSYFTPPFVEDINDDRVSWWRPQFKKDPFYKGRKNTRFMEWKRYLTLWTLERPYLPICCTFLMLFRSSLETFVYLWQTSSQNQELTPDILTTLYFQLMSGVCYWTISELPMGIH